ncbi:MAG: hypothetical protein J7K64_06725 [Bacteroidales bacterium]|nr:hypothetical protein [Bacteroidales bacterium]
MGGHIFEIIIMLLGAAILGFFIGWFLKNNKITELQEYIAALEDKNNRLQADYNQNEHLLIECQTEKRKTEAEKQQIEKLLIECERKLTLSDIELAKNKIESTSQTVVSAPKTKAKAKAKTKAKTKVKTDNLKKIEGIGPKIASILKEAKIESFIKLSKAKAEKISDLLVKVGGNSYNRFDPTTWPEQAKLAAEEKWEELKNLQDELKGGRKK